VDPWDSYARAAGWHVYNHPGSPDAHSQTTALCPDHAGNVKRSMKPLHLDGEQPLW